MSNLTWLPMISRTGKFLGLWSRPVARILASKSSHAAVAVFGVGFISAFFDELGFG